MNNHYAHAGAVSRHLLLLLLLAIAPIAARSQTLDPPVPQTTTVCPGGSLPAQVSSTGSFPANTTFTLELSNATGSFAAPVTIYSTTIPVATTNFSGTLPGTVPFAIPAGTGYRIRWTASTGQTSADNGSNITVLSAPAAPVLSSNDPVCAGQTLNLSTASTGMNYSWTGPNGFSSNLQNPSIPNATTAASGTYTLTVTDPGTGCSSFDTMNVTVNPIPAANTVSNQTVCNGAATSPVNFTGPVPGTTYNYTNNNPSIGLPASGSGNIGSFNAVNTGNTPVTATITVTPAANGCTGTPTTFTYTVNPTPTVNTTGNQTVCNGATTNPVTFTGSVAGTTYTWTNNTPSIGLASGGTGNIPAFTAMNTGSAPVTATITVTPTANGCTGTPATFTYTVNPTPSVNTVSGQTICNGTATAPVSFGGPVSGTTFSYTNNNTSIGLAGTGTGNIASFTGTNTGSAPVTATVTVTPSANGCTGTPSNFTITVNPTPTVNAPSNQTVCNGTNTAAVNFTGAVAGTTYNWTNNTPSVGLAAAGSGSIPAFAAVNNGTAPVTATITVTPTANGCTGTPQSFTITVNPTPSVSAVSNQTLCNGATTAGINFGGPVSGTTFSYTNNTPSIGLAGTGTGNIAGFTATNTGNAPVTATIMVTPGANGCTGPTQNFTITVNPTPTVNTVTSQTVCNGAATTPVNFTGAVSGTGFSWTNNVTSTGLGASGSGNIPSFTAMNNTSGTVVSTVTVTPAANGCTGTPATFTYTVRPTPTVNAVPAQTVCNGAAITPITFTGPVSGTNFSWTSSNTSIGLAGSGTGNIAGFNAVNNGSTPATSTITVTPSANGCAGTPQSFTITVNPTPMVTPVANQTVCNGSATGTVSFSGPVSGTSYSWTNSNASIGLATSGTGPIPAFNGVNNGNTPVTATIVVTPMANGCTGMMDTFTITVNPTPMVSTVASQTLCGGAMTTPVSFSGNVTGTAFTWTNTATGIGLPASGSGNITSFTATNNTSGPITGVITVTPAANGCSGMPVSFTITVNPRPAVGPSPDFAVCNGDSLAIGAFSSMVTGTAFTWTNSNPGIGLPASGTGNIPVFQAVDTMNTPAVATIVVTPATSTCTGIMDTFTITVNPTPTLSSPMNAGSICSNTWFMYTPQSGVSGTGFTWSRDSISGISNPAAGGTDSIAEVLVNTTPDPVVVTYRYLLNANGCVNSHDVTVTVNPTPVLSSADSAIACSGSPFTYTPASLTSGTSFSWSRIMTAGITPDSTSGSGAISEILTSDTSAPVTVMYVFTLTANGCSGTDTLRVTVNPAPSAPLLTTTPPDAVCRNTMYQNYGTGMMTDSMTSYTWSAVNADIVNQGSTGQNILVSFTNSGMAVVTLTATTLNSGCTATASDTVMVSNSASHQPNVIYFNDRFIAQIADADLYRWGYDDRTTLDSVLIANETGQDYFNPAPDLANRFYWVMTEKDGCMQKSYYNTPTDVSAPMATVPELKVFPNPATDAVSVELAGVSSKAVEFALYDLTGKLITSVKARDGKAMFHVSGLAQGMYSIICTGEGRKISVARFIKN